MNAVNCQVVCDQGPLAAWTLGALRGLGIEVSGGSLSSAAALSALGAGGTSVDLVVVVCKAASDADVLLITSLRLACPSATVVALGQACSADEILRLIRAGANDYIDFSRPQAAQEELRSLVARMRAPRPDIRETTGRLITVIAASGGCGASSLTVNLAVALARRQGTCGLIDLNLRGGDLALLLNLHPQHTVADLCHEHRQGRLDRSVFQQSLTEHPSGVRLLASPAHLEDHGYLPLEALKELLSLSLKLFPLTVAELEDVFHEEQVHALKTADHVVVVLRLDFPCLLRTHKLLKRLQGEGVPLEKVILVANRCPRHSDISPAQSREALGQPIQHYIPDDLPAMLSAVNLGNPVVLEMPRSKPAKALAALAEQFLSV